MNFGETIKALRKNIGILPPELARRCKVSPTTIYDIENGKRSASEKLIILLAEQLNADPDPLLELRRRRQELIKRVRENPEEFAAILEKE